MGQDFEKCENPGCEAGVDLRHSKWRLFWSGESVVKRVFLEPVLQSRTQRQQDQATKQDSQGQITHTLSS